MDKKQAVAIAVILLAVSFTFGCVQTGTSTDNRSIEQAKEGISEDDNLEPALQELQELEMAVS